MRALVLSSAFAVFAAIGSAKAEPVALPSDQMDQVTAGAYAAAPPFGINVYKNVAINKYKNLRVYADLYSNPYVRGNLAEAEAAANAYGHHTFSETLTLSEVAEGYYSKSFSESMSATNGAEFRKVGKKY